MLETLKHMSDKNLEKCLFYLYGSPSPTRKEEGEELAMTIKKYNLEKYVKLCGFKDNISEIYNESDVVLIPSIMADPFPTTVLEAMMFRKPVIVTNHGGASEIVDETFGRIIAPNNCEQFLSALEFYIDNANLISEMGDIARKYYEDYLTLGKFKERVMIFFKNKFYSETKI